MPWHASVHPDLPIVETCYSGVLTPSELSAAVREPLTLARTSGRTLLLSDCSALVGGHSIHDLYCLANAISLSGTGYSLKEAFLLPALPASVEMVKFWVTVCCNRGINVRIFSDRQSALDWLLDIDNTQPVVPADSLCPSPPHPAA